MIHSRTQRRIGFVRPRASMFIMAAVTIVIAFYSLYPPLLLIINAFNTAERVFSEPRQWGLDNWASAWDQRGVMRSLLHSITIWAIVVGISFPVATIIAWVLARTRIPFSHSLEFLFWISYMVPGIATTIGWIMLMDPSSGILNTVITKLPFIANAPFNIFSVPGIVWAHIMANGISIKVMLLTPAFRNMDASLEEAAKVNGASDFMTMVRITLPLMVSPMILVFALQLIRIFQSFEIEQLLGTPIKYYVYSTMIFRLIRQEVPQYGEATVLATVTLLVVLLIIPFQKWILGRRSYATVTGKFKPGLIDLGRWRWVVFSSIAALIFLLTLAPVLVLIVGSFMTRAGFFMLANKWTLDHWTYVLTDPLFLKALRTTVLISFIAGFLSPLLFSFLAYIIVRTRWPGRTVLDSVIWISATIPGILSGLGLLWFFLGTPGFSALYGTIWALLIVVIIGGKTTGVNIMKGVFVQGGADMEEAARVSGHGWLSTYIRIWLPIIMPTFVLIGVMNFVQAASATSSIVLLASRDTLTLSLLALEFIGGGVDRREEAGIISLVIIVMTVGVAVVARRFGLDLGVRHH